MFSNSQQAHYRPLVKRAWLAHCLRNDLDEHVVSARDAWYRAQLMEACGIYTTKEANKKDDFDAVMGHFAEIAGDEYWMDRAAEGRERRLRFLIEREIRLGRVNEAYVAGIARNMGFGDEYMNLPAEHLWRIWNALLRHNKRESKRQTVSA